MPLNTGSALRQLPQEAQQEIQATGQNQFLAGVDVQRDIKKRNGGLDPRSKIDLNVIAGIMQRKKNGQLPQDEEQALIALNPKISGILQNTELGDAVRIGREFSTQAQPAIPAQPAVQSQPAQPFVDEAGTAFEQGAVPDFESQPQGLIQQEAIQGQPAVPGQPATKASFDISGAVQEALRIGRPDLAKQYADFDSSVASRLSALSDKEFTQAATLRKEHIKASKRFVDVRDSYGRIIESGAEPSPAGDLSLIFNYMKMLDPESVVRESEFATAENTGSVPQRIWARYNKVLQGERLAPTQRIDFMARAKKLYGRQLKTQRQQDRRTMGLSRRFGIVPNLVVQDFALERDADKALTDAIKQRAKPASKRRRRRGPRLTPEKRRRMELLRSKRDAAE